MLPILVVLVLNECFEKGGIISSLSASAVIVDDDLHVLRRLDLGARGVVAGGSRLWVDVDHLAIALVLKEQPRLAVCDHLEVGRGVARNLLRAPVEVREI